MINGLFMRVLLGRSCFVCEAYNNVSTYHNLISADALREMIISRAVRKNHRVYFVSTLARRMAIGRVMSLVFLARDGSSPAIRPPIMHGAADRIWISVCFCILCGLDARKKKRCEPLHVSDPNYSITRL
jgi:hypothetical protein